MKRREIAADAPKEVDVTIPGWVSRVLASLALRLITFRDHGEVQGLNHDHRMLGSSKRLLELTQSPEPTLTSPML